MNFRNLFIGAVAILSLAACSKANDNPTVNGGGGDTNLRPNAEETRVDTYQAGTPNFIFNVESRDRSIDGLPLDRVDENTFQGFDMLGAQNTELETATKIVATKENSLELWSGEAVLLAFDLRGESPALLHSRSGSFRLESAVWTMDAAGEGQGQGLSNGTLTINMRECMVEQPKEQDQHQDKGEDQDKGQGQGQGIVAGTEEQDQGKPQEKPEEPKPAEICKTLSFVYHAKEVEQPKEQDQGKGEEQDQGKGEEQDQGKGEEQGKDEGKPVDEGKPSDQDKDQGQDEGKPVDEGKPSDQDKDQGQDEGKDQGKDEGKPVDEGKPSDQGQGQDEGGDQGTR